jgi:hypothetical protein
VPVNLIESEANTLRNNKSEEMMVEILLSAALLIRKILQANKQLVSTIFGSIIQAPRHVSNHVIVVVQDMF